MKMSKEQDIKTIMDYVKGVKPKYAYSCVFNTDENGKVICTSKQRVNGEPLYIEVCKSKEDVLMFHRMEEKELEKIASIYD